MPLMTGKVKTPKFPDVSWDKPRGRLKHVYVPDGERHTVYVIEEPEGERGILYGGSTYKLLLPWRYFFIKVRYLEAPFVPNDCGAYIFFAERKAKTLDDPVLLIPHLPNLFLEGGICPNHQTYYGRGTPLRTAINFIRWFYKSSGNFFFSNHTPPDYVEEKEKKSTYFWDGDFIRDWASFSRERARSLQWKKAEYRSIGEAAQSLLFNYWKRWRVITTLQQKELEKRLDEENAKRLKNKEGHLGSVALQDHTDP